MNLSEVSSVELLKEVFERIITRKISLIVRN